MPHKSEDDPNDCVLVKVPVLAVPATAPAFSNCTESNPQYEDNGVFTMAMETTMPLMVAPLGMLNPKPAPFNV